MTLLRTEGDLRSFLVSRGPFETAVWDFDGVVCDSEPWQADAYRRVLLARGVHVEHDFFAPYVGLTEPEIWDRIVAARELAAERADLIDERQAELRPRLLRDAAPNWFVRPALAALRTAGTPSVVLSSGDTALIEAYLAHWRLAGSFDRVSGHGPDAAPKADRLTELIGSATGRVLLVEDMAAYLELGSRLGAVTVAVAHGLNAGAVGAADATLEAAPERVGAGPEGGRDRSR